MCMQVLSQHNSGGRMAGMLAGSGRAAAASGGSFGARCLQQYQAQDSMKWQCPSSSLLPNSPILPPGSPFPLPPRAGRCAGPPSKKAKAEKTKKSGSGSGENLGGSGVLNLFGGLTGTSPA